MEIYYKYTKKQFLALLLVGLTSVATFVAIHSQMSKTVNEIPGSYNLKGIWELSTDGKHWNSIVSVPEPLSPELKNKLMQTFAYRKTVIVRDWLSGKYDTKDISIYLGALKGVHEVYLDGIFIGGGPKLGVAVYPIPQKMVELLAKKDRFEVLVKFEFFRTMFPGIVHHGPVCIGKSSFTESVRLDYFFEVALKPLIPTIFKLTLFLLFMLVFIFVPKRREYFSFSLFVFFSGASNFVQSRLFPGNENYYFRNLLMYEFTCLSLALFPVLASEFLRFSQKENTKIFFVSFLGWLMFALAPIWIQSDDGRIVLYQRANFLMPLLTIGPSIITTCWQCYCLAVQGVSRRRLIQIGMFFSFSILNLIKWETEGSQFLTYTLVQFPELVDLFIVIGLAATLIIDFRIILNQYETFTSTLPSWIKRSLDSGTTGKSEDLYAVVVAVDAVSYTKILSRLKESEKNQVHDIIRKAFVAIQKDYWGEKLSDRGDGCIFSWQLNNDSKDAEKIVQIIAALSHLTSDFELGIKFRIGVAVGKIRSEYRGGEISFLGEAINVASRLEAVARPSEVCFDDTADFFLKKYSQGYSEKEVKGVMYKWKYTSVFYKNVPMAS